MKKRPLVVIIPIKKEAIKIINCEKTSQENALDTLFTYGGTKKFSELIQKKQQYSEMQSHKIFMASYMFF